MSILFVFFVAHNGSLNDSRKLKKRIPGSSTCFECTIDTLERAQLAAATLVERLDPTETGSISEEDLDLGSDSGDPFASPAIGHIGGCIDNELVRCTLQRELSGDDILNVDLKDALTVGFCEAAAVKEGNGAKTAHPLSMVSARM